MRQDIEQLAEQIRLADAIVIGAGSGLSSAAGYNHYHWTPAMEEYLRDFKACYGFASHLQVFIIAIPPQTSNGPTIPAISTACIIFQQDNPIWI